MVDDRGSPDGEVLERDESADRPARVVVGGQVPPPLSGQHVAVERVVTRLREDSRFDVEHLPYRFALTMTDQGRVTVAKVLTLIRLVVRVVSLRRSGPVDLFLHPISGPAIPAAVRDAAVVLAARMVSRSVVLQFHGGGHGVAWQDPTWAQRVLARAFSVADLAVVHARIHERDPAAVGIDRVEVVPHRLPDRRRLELRPSEPTGRVDILYVGHLGPHRGTPELLRAVARLHEQGRPVHLTLVGQPAQGWTRPDLDRHLASVPDGVVEHHGELTGRRLDTAFAAADLFAFPSRFVAETFGLVMVEALMWGLPVVATDWGAARELLTGDDLDVVVHPVEPSLEDELLVALAGMVDRLLAGEVDSPSAANRRHYEQYYRDDVDPLADVLADVVTGRAGRCR